MDQREAEASYGITGDDLTPALNWTQSGLRKIWNERKKAHAVNRDSGEIWWDQSLSFAFYWSGVARSPGRPGQQT